MNNVILVFVGGGLGSLSRYGISELVKKQTVAAFPLATFLSNLLSCFILALAVSLFASRLTAQPALRFLLITGFCGGFSTFSAFSFETAELIRAGNTALAGINVTLSLGVCIGLVYFLSKTV